MKIKSFFKPITRQLAKLGGSTKTKSIASSMSSASSLSSGTTPRRMSSIGSMTSEDSFSSHFAAHGQAAAQRALSSALRQGLANPTRIALRVGQVAIQQERARVDGLLEALGTAERKHIRAKYELSTITLKCTQVEREHGTNSAVAKQAQYIKQVATKKFQIATADLYLAKIAF